MSSSKKRFLALLIVFFLLANIHIVSASDDLAKCAATGLISPSQAITCMLGALGITEESIKEMATAADTTKWKKLSPQVTLTFSPPNPVPGEKATASAMPTNFSNPADAQYFTWYLQTVDCPPNAKYGELNSDLGNTKDYPQSSDPDSPDKRCNLSGNYEIKDGKSYGIVDVEDYKIKAMRIYASNGFDWESADYSSKSGATDSYKAILGGADQKNKENHCYFYNTNTGDFTEFFKDGPNATGEECFHLFPEFSGHPTGEDSFNKKEAEEHWHTNPNAPDTAGTGHPDEANVVGLGAKDFSWTYQAGDMLGVAVEGVAIDPTMKKNSSYKIMWAFLNNDCSVLPKYMNTYPDPDTHTNEQLYNQCLQENMLAPTEGGGANEKIDVSLSFSPANPVNDTSSEGDNADWINVVSTIGNSTKSESLHYDWKVYAGQFADADGEWGDTLLKSDLIGVEQTVGAGIPNLKFKANFPDAPKYLKVRLNVSEKVTSTTGGTRLGLAEVVIPLSSFDNKLSAFNTIVNTSLYFHPDSLTDTLNYEEICKIPAGSTGQLVDAAICQVAPDEIIAVKANIILKSGETLKDYDFLWTLNGQSPSYKYDPDFTKYDPNLASDKLPKPNRLIYFPVLAPTGSTLNLSLVATNQKTGNKISLAKTFLVSEPTFKIISKDNNTAKPKLLGNYLDLEGKPWPDFSQTEFWAKKDSAIKLSVEQFASSPLPSEEDLDLSPSPLKWYLNDAVLGETIRKPSFSGLAADAGSSFSLSAKGLYTQDINTKKALRDYWGVSLDEYYEQQLSQKIDFTVVDADVFGEMAAAKNDKQKILASFISSVPAYFAFLFRIVMTAFVLLSAIWILFALFPQAQKND